ncbi:hypothetical protein H8E65_03075 [Candidatus Bathyarchaeota archaeon]|nr:hypothetical protein [Candidatus Bathyarchaeota archaeon]
MESMRLKVQRVLSVIFVGAGYQSTAPWRFTMADTGLTGLSLEITRIEAARMYVAVDLLPYGSLDLRVYAVAMKRPGRM